MLIYLKFKRWIQDTYVCFSLEPYPKCKVKAVLFYLQKEMREI